MRAYGNNWHDAIMGEIELGSRDAYIAMAWEERFTDEANRSYDHGISGMELWHIFEVDYLVDEKGYTVEEAYASAQDTPWGPYDWTDEMVAADEALVRDRAEREELDRLDRLLQHRP